MAQGGPSQKGFGFIQPDDGAKHVFVHISVVERSGIDNLNEGQKPSYERETGRNEKSLAVALKARWLLRERWGFVRLAVWLPRRTAIWRTTNTR